MRALPKSHTLAGWAFAAAGWVLITRPCGSVDDFFHLRAMSLAIFPHHFAPQAFFMAFSLFGLLAADALSFITAWGVGQQRSWSRWTGTLPCLYLLAAFPYLTAFGLLGLWYLWRRPAPKRAPLTADEFWNPRRQSGWMLIACVAGWFVVRRAIDTPSPGLAVVLFLLWLHTAIHEIGHALAAWRVGSQLNSLAAGPLIFTRESGRL